MTAVMIGIDPHKGSHTAVAALLVPAMAVRRNRVGPGEAKRWLSAVNGNEFAAERYMPGHPRCAGPTMSRTSRWPHGYRFGACRR